MLLVHGRPVVSPCPAGHGALVGLEVVEGGRVAVGVEGEAVDLLVLDVDALLADGGQLTALGKEHDDEGQRADH